MPIAFPCLLSEMILSQHPHILRGNEAQLPKGTPLNFDYRLFAGTHVQDIEVPTAKDSDTSASVTGPVKENILSELIETSKTLQETIRICSDKKARIDKLIMQLQAEQEDDEEEADAGDKGVGASKAAEETDSEGVSEEEESA